MEEKVNEFQKNRGVILSHASDIEQFLEFLFQIILSGRKTKKHSF